MKYSDVLNTVQAFIRIEKVNNMSEDCLFFGDVSSSRRLGSNIYKFNNFSNFSFELENIRHQVESAGHKGNGEYVYGITIDILLPVGSQNNGDDCKLRMVKKLVKEHFNDYPSYFWVYKIKELEFLKIFICDRQFYGKVKEQITYYSCDSYINKKTKKFCKAGDQDSVLLHKTGEIKETYMLPFEITKNRELFPCYLGKDAFKKYIHNFKLNVIIPLIKGFGFFAIEEVTFPKISYTSISKDKSLNDKQKRIKLGLANMINKKLDAMGKDLTRLYNEENAFIKELKNLYLKFFNEIEQGFFSPGKEECSNRNIRFHINIDTNRRVLKENLFFFTQDFTKALMDLPLNLAFSTL